MSEPQSKHGSKWTLTQEAFDQLLLSFGDDRDSGGKKYLEFAAT